ncbi:hypothetical protein JCM19235_6206 [Vibrio maritimus]|uniref:Uncharacterized protein n=1 Tax=Vibrio maritimus TaxID=990268 RepID=A0A090RSV4_9VIBR|nr:hypothetical protein JCM19235_6206 [Vibrio maritimus]
MLNLFMSLFSKFFVVLIRVLFDGLALYGLASPSVELFSISTLLY